jgi:hypothetical protein
MDVTGLDEISEGVSDIITFEVIPTVLILETPQGDPLFALRTQTAENQRRDWTALLGRHLQLVMSGSRPSWANQQLHDLKLSEGVRLFGLFENIEEDDL